MQIPNSKKIVCITGSVWTGKHDAPRHVLVKEGFIRPEWFTTGRPLSDANYQAISDTDFHLANAESKVLAYMKYGGVFTGIMKSDFQEALDTAETGVLVVGFQEIIAQIAMSFTQAIIFAFKQEGTELSDHLNDAVRNRQVHRLDIDVLKAGAWDEVLEYMRDVLEK